MKKCKKCERTLPLDEFYKKPGGKDGLNARCKECYLTHYRVADRALPRVEPAVGGQRKCIDCLKTKPLDDFNIDRRRKDGRTTRCRPCSAEYFTRYRAENYDRLLDLQRMRRERVNKRSAEARKRVAEYAAKYVARNQEWYYDYLSEHPCVECGETDPEVLDADHIPERGPKTANIGELVYYGGSIERIVAELELCEIVCGNCHQRRTNRRGNYYRYRIKQERATRP